MSALLLLFITVNIKAMYVPVLGYSYKKTFFPQTHAIKNYLSPQMNTDKSVLKVSKHLCSSAFICG